MLKKIRVVILILNWQRYQLTISCLKSLQKIDQNGLEIKIYLLDNGSTNDSASRLLKFARESSPPVLFFQSKKNLGFTKGNNFLLKRALIDGFDYFCLLNNDTVVDQNFLQELIKVAESDQNIGAVGGKIYYLGKKYPTIWYAGGAINSSEIYLVNPACGEKDNYQYDEIKETDFITGCLFLIKAKVLKKTGLFDERFFHSYEDVDLSLRIKREGYKLVYCPEAIIWHQVSASAEINSEFSQYFTTKDAFLYVWKWLPIRTKLFSLVEGARTIIKEPYWKKMAILDFFLLRFGKGSWENA